MEGIGRYPCRHIAISELPYRDSAVWQEVPQVALVDVESGSAPRLKTFFQIFRDDIAQRLNLRFHGEDDEVNSRFTMHDEPLHRQDVVELFIADGERLDRYKELQLSPWGIGLDGLISFDAEGTRRLDVGWDAPGWQTRCGFDLADRSMYSIWALPYALFDSPPKPGTSWRFNALRIDHSGQGISLQAWQRTGEPNFHRPERFGYLDFLD